MEIVVIVGVLSLVMGGGAYLNEHVIKPQLAVARPNIRALAEAGALNITAEKFYALPDKPTRSEHLRAVLTAPGFDSVRLHPLIRDHWISESGFSFPSGHSLSAMLYATFFLGMGLSLVEGQRRLPFYLLIFWAVLVCYSRPILRVQSATDVLLGGLEGAVLGVLSFVLVRGVLAVTGGNAPTSQPRSDAPPIKPTS